MDIQTVDENNHIFILLHSMKITYSLYAAYEIGLFDLLVKHKVVYPEQIATNLQIPIRSAEALISMCDSIGLIKQSKDRLCSLTPMSECFLNKESPYSIGYLLELNLENKDITLNYESFKMAIIKGTSQIYNGADLFESNFDNSNKCLEFTKAMHAKSSISAEKWPRAVNLEDSSKILDIGGGSGVHMISAANHFPHIEAIVLDRLEVCNVANCYIKKATLEHKITTYPADLWSDEFPKADVHFYCDIFHDWDKTKITTLLNKSYNSLPNGGKILIYEMLFDDTKSGPLSTSMFNLSMLLWTEGQQLSKIELHQLLDEAGFESISMKYVDFGDWIITEARKTN